MSGTLPIVPGLPKPATSGPGAMAGAIPGGLLRPGAIDQQAFKLALARANQPTQPAKSTESGTNQLLPSAGPVQLTPAQFQALTGAPVPPAETQAPTGEPVPPQATSPDIAAPAAPEPSHEILTLRRMPDKDERDMLRGKSWRIVEDPRARELYFGPDGEFGLDDFIDLINPLQHIPFVNVLYRQLTGDQIAGAPQLLGSIVFGPMSVAATIADLAVKSTTGKSMADNALALFIGEPAADTSDQLAYIDNDTELERGSRRS